MDRRRFLQASGACSLTLLAPELERARADGPRDETIRLGVIADVHQDIMHDGIERISAFVSDMQSQQAHGIINLGDFCVPHSRNDSFMAKWNEFTGGKFHVLGNHDTDGGFRREQTVEYYQSQDDTLARISMAYI